MKQNDTHQRLELRRAVVSSAFTMLMLVTVIGLFSLFSIWSINRAWLSGTGETAELQQLSRAALDAQVAFKVQVQEWKNVLLRGDDPALLQRYSKAFRDRAKDTEDSLARVAAEADRMGFAGQAGAARSSGDAHRVLTARYESTLAAKLGGATVLLPAAAREIDLSLRGIDRDLEGAIGRLSADIAGLSEQRRAGLGAEMQERYRALRLFIIAVILLSIVIMGFVLSRALRATRG